jgi:hypothetical protein
MLFLNKISYIICVFVYGLAPYKFNIYRINYFPIICQKHGCKAAAILLVYVL